ncbi:MAG: histidine--tRNA ligase [Bacteroidales bacterium]|nr:histidine--tRNA ligase [Fournierella massiliensis]MCF2557339.1 histidine--tRNA ligase [Fournierella massiliensis]MCI6739294.1 histidine--tRNA ligase [Bacteroidales bacterium]
MNCIKTPTKGMNDYLPADMRLREYVLNLIKTTYAGYGFCQIETPCVEHIENLTSKQGGENEKLIFKILKRGEKLAEAHSPEEMCDSGLRYDLTLPLSRYYANNMASLPSPFKALQIGNVWRADRPQKGRFRQFTQCDIDILGDATNLAEIELINATTSVLCKLGFENFKVRVNDRRILKAMAAAAGFAEESYGEVFIILDKMDKIGLEGVEKELLESGYPQAAVEAYVAFFRKAGQGLGCAEFCGEALADTLEAGVVQNLDTILDCVRATAAGSFELVFDPTLVRGMGYYTGTIFEVELPEFGSSVAGGGRYDEMVGRFCGQKVPACGFSIGFERIITILKDRGFTPPQEGSRVAFLADKALSGQQLVELFRQAAELRAQGVQVMVTTRKKNAKNQKEVLKAEGYTDFREFFA